MNDNSRFPPSIKSFNRPNTAKILDVSERTVDRLIKSGELKAYSPINRSVRITEDSIRNLIERRQLVSETVHSEKVQP